MKDYLESERRDAEFYLRSRPPCDCGECVDCLLRRELGGTVLKNQILKGKFQMSTENQNIVEKFVNGPDYLRQWNADAKLRQEFDGDFESYCYYKSAYDNGQVRIQGVR